MKWFIANTRYNALTLILNVVPTMFLTPTLTFHTFLGRWCLLVVVLASCAPPRLPRQMIWSDAHVECLSGGQTRWLPQTINCGEYGRWGNTFNFKSCMCFMLWPAVWRCALSCCRHTRSQQTMAFSLSCWLNLIPELVTVLDTVHKLKLSQAVSYYEFYTVFQFFIWVTFVGGIDCVCVYVNACVRPSMCGVYLHFFLQVMNE